MNFCDYFFFNIFKKSGEQIAIISFPSDKEKELFLVVWKLGLDMSNVLLLC